MINDKKIIRFIVFLMLIGGVGCISSRKTRLLSKNARYAIDTRLSIPYRLLKEDSLKSYGVISRDVIVSKNITTNSKITKLLLELKNSDFYNRINENAFLYQVTKEKLYNVNSDSICQDYFIKSANINFLVEKFYKKNSRLIGIRAFGGDHRVYFYESKYFNIDIFNNNDLPSRISPYHKTSLFRNRYGDTIDFNSIKNDNLIGFEQLEKTYILVLPIIIDGQYQFDVELVFMN